MNTTQKKYERPTLTIWMPYFCYELHFRRPERIVFGKCKMGFKDTTLTVNRKKHNRLKVLFTTILWWYILCNVLKYSATA